MKCKQLLKGEAGTPRNIPPLAEIRGRRRAVQADCVSRIAKQFTETVTAGGWVGVNIHQATRIPTIVGTNVFPMKSESLLVLRSFPTFIKAG